MEGVREAPHDIENPKDPLQEELDNLLPVSPLRCIYRVPKRLRRFNEEAYTPQVVSIGPLHHGKEHLKAMEEHKKRYLQAFLTRTGVSFPDYIQMIKGQEGRLRGCYAEPIEFGSDEFVRIVLVDAAFVIEFLLRFYSPDYRLDEDDYIFEKPVMIWDVRLDLQLLENQLPFFILQVLFNTFKCPEQLLLMSSFNNFQYEVHSMGKYENFEKICSSGVEVKHFVDLIRILHLPLESKSSEPIDSIAVPNVTELVQAGVKFRVRKDSSSLFDIKFSDGILEIPELMIDDNTEARHRNLVAFEQCHDIEEDYVSNYNFLMKHLVKTPKDVELLVEYGIIDNWLADTKKVSTLLDDLGRGVVHTHLYYATIRKGLNNYCRTRRHKWMANLKQNYFNTPWSIISVVAAVILLILTLIQTACSIKSVP